jgi:uncharacterized protein (TIGR00730 family)
MPFPLAPTLLSAIPNQELIMNKIFPVVAFSLLAACAAPISTQEAEDQTAESSEGALTAGAIRIYLSPNKCKKPGAYVPSFANATVEQVALDAYCGEQFGKRAAPQGWVAVFGSSRLADGTPEYANARKFANLWTAESTPYPIMSGGGPGLMEAANRGAKEAKGNTGVSIGMSTYFKGPTDTLNAYVTDGYMFSDFETRERAMIRNAKAVVIYWGGVGTAWELFMSLSDVQTKRLVKVPIILVGKDWTDAVGPYLQYMKTKGTISPTDLDLFKVVETPEQTVAALKAAMAP